MNHEKVHQDICYPFSYCFTSLLTYLLNSNDYNYLLLHIHEKSKLW